MNSRKKVFFFTVTLFLLSRGAFAQGMPSVSPETCPEMMHEVSADVSCGSVSVPLDRAYAEGSHIPIWFGYVPASEQPHESLGTIVHITGTGVPVRPDMAFTPEVLAGILDVAERVGEMPSAFDAAVRGNWQPLNELAAAQLDSSDQTAPHTSDSPALYFVAMCNSWVKPYTLSMSVEERKAALTRASLELPDDTFAPLTVMEKTNRYGGILPYALCLEYPQGEDALPIPSADTLPDVPVFVVVGELDTATPVVDNRRVAAQFERSILVVAHDTNHTALAYNPCLAEQAAEFLTTLGVADLEACVDANPITEVTSRVE
jgi:pimeloyl-ACP methyl ester carboxylesterase